MKKKEIEKIPFRGGVRADKCGRDPQERAGS